MKLLVIGHSVEDHIKSGKEEIIKPGGINYTAAALSSVATQDEIYLCTFVERVNYQLFSEVYKRFEPDFITFTNAIPKVSLTIHGSKERDERYDNLIRNLDIPYERLKEFDGILINMVTGFDIDIKILKKIRQNFRGFIYLDVHTLSRGIGHHGDRDFKKIDHFEDWAKYLDIIQANENEVKTLTDYSDEEEIAQAVLKYGIKQLIITKGKAGAKVYYLQNGELNFIYHSALNIEAENSIGLGDVFEAVYFYNYIKTGDLFSSLEKAVNASGIAAGHDGFSKLKIL
jgi:hypothetical protein